MTHKEILQNHTNKVFLYDMSQGYSIKVPRGAASIFSSKQRFGPKKKRPCDRKNTVQGFLPEIYTILIFYLKALSTKYSVATLIKTS